MKNFVLAITMLASCSVSFAQVPGFPKGQRQVTQQQAGLAQAKRDALAKSGHSPDDSTTCAFNFTSGSNNTFLNFCVTGNGNVVVLETPQGVPQVSFSEGEGYGVCDLNTNVAYSDYGDFNTNGSGNWGPATVVSHSGTSVKIARTSTDGIWTLTQVITQVSGNTPNVKIAMSLKNNTGIERAAFLMRYADVDADATEQNNLDATFNTAMAYNSILGNGGGGAPFGLTLQNIGNTRFPFDAFAQNTFEPPDPCNPFASIAGPTVADGSIVQLYFLDLAKAGSGTVTVAYRGM